MLSPMTRTRVQGKVLVITGASSGIGRAAAMQFARKGARVVLAARGLASLQDVAVRHRPRRGRHCPRADRIETVYRELDAVEQALDLMGPRATSSWCSRMTSRRCSPASGTRGSSTKET